MDSKRNYIQLQDLEVYKLARKLSEIAWDIYKDLNWQTKKTVGDQFLTSTDSTGANIAEGYGRFHYLDKIKFYYNSRASLVECGDHWLELLKERHLVEEVKYQTFKSIAQTLMIKLNNFITATYNSKKKQ